MKKWLILILLGFVLTSMYAFSYTNQIIGSFNNFDEDNGNGGEDDSVEGSLIYPKITSQKSKVKIIWNNTYTATGTTHQIVPPNVIIPGFYLPLFFVDYDSINYF